VQVLLLPPKYFPRVIDETLPELPKQLGGGSGKIVTQGVLWAAAGIDPPPHPAVHLIVQSKDASAAEALRAKLLVMMNMVIQNREFRQFIPKPEETVALLTPKVEGDRLTVTLDEQNQGIKTLFTLLAPPIEQARAAAYRAMSINNLKQMGLAMHNYHDKNKHFPLPAILGAEKKPLLSWRVQLLPIFEQYELYKQFHLDEPWDSEHNRKLIDQMPAVFKHPLSKKENGYTNYVLPVGNGVGFESETPTKFKDLKDGSSNTIMIVEVDDDHAVIWTKPDDLTFDPENPANGLGRFFKDRFNTAFFDGSVHNLKLDIPAKTLRALFTRAGQEVINQDEVN
jgi:hypothetical protein